MLLHSNVNVIEILFFSGSVLQLLKQLKLLTERVFFKSYDNNNDNNNNENENENENANANENENENEKKNKNNKSGSSSTVFSLHISRNN